MNHHNKTTGFTLIEILIASGILAIILFAVFGFTHYLSQSYQFSLTQTLSVEEASRTSAQLVREIREIQMGSGGAYPLQQTEDQAITFFTDLDDDGIAEKVRYWLDGTNLNRGVTKAEGTPLSYPEASESVRLVAGNIVNGNLPIFYYYNQDWPIDELNNPLSHPGRLLSTRLVKIELQVRTGQEQSLAPVTVTNAVAVRSIKSNL